MTKKKRNPLPATRVRYRVFAWSKSHLKFDQFAKKKQAMKYSSKNLPATVTDTMACIGSPQVWRVDETGIHCVKRRSA